MVLHPPAVAFASRGSPVVEVPAELEEVARDASQASGVVGITAFLFLSVLGLALGLFAVCLRVTFFFLHFHECIV